jgi:hypothetical protein
VTEKGDFPRCGCKRSFEKAVHHLFRHLHDSSVFRNDPLVRRFFEDPAKRGSEPTSDEAVLDRIHDLVRLDAERCRDADLLKGKSAQAYRQQAIIALQRFEQRPISASAAELGISYQHCYRERANICLLGCDLRAERVLRCYVGSLAADA